MRFHAVAILLVASLTVSPLCSAAGDNKLSSEFLAPARGYLRTLRECSNRAVRDDNADSCDVRDERKKTDSATITPGDKAVFRTLNTWAGILSSYQFFMVSAPMNEEQKSKTRSQMKHKVDVCGAELEKTLQAAVAPEKSECDGVLRPK